MPDDEAALRFLADMGVSWRIVEWLRSEGYDAKHLRDDELERLEDHAIFTKAKEENRVLLTFDLDFAEIAAHAGNRMVNIVVFRLRNARTPFVTGRLSRVLAESAEALVTGLYRRGRRDPSPSSPPTDRTGDA